MNFTNIDRIPDEPYLYLLPNVDFNPIFIMGDHRSGTTLLYKILVATECFTFINAYHVINYNEILSNYVNKTQDRAHQALEEQFKSLGISDRVIDRVAVNPNLPEEYGFILKNIVGDESCITPQNLPLFQQLCRKVQFVSNSDKPLLLKNPWDFSQFMYVKSAVAKTRFIFIHRHPIHTINSKLKAVRSFLSNWNPYIALISKRYKKLFANPLQRFFYLMLYSRYFDLGLRQVTQQSLGSTTYFLQNIEALSQTDYVAVRYEDLCNRPEETILRILGFLGLETRAILASKTLIEPRSLKLLPEVQRQYEEIRKKLQPYFDYCDYEV